MFVVDLLCFLLFFSWPIFLFFFSLSLTLGNRHWQLRVKQHTYKETKDKNLLCTFLLANVTNLPPFFGVPFPSHEEHESSTFSNNQKLLFSSLFISCHCGGVLAVWL